MKSGENEQNHYGNISVIEVLSTNGGNAAILLLAYYKYKVLEFLRLEVQQEYILIDYRLSDDRCKSVCVCVLSGVLQGQWQGAVRVVARQGSHGQGWSKCVYIVCTSQMCCFNNDAWIGESAQVTSSNVCSASSDWPLSRPTWSYLMEQFLQTEILKYCWSFTGFSWSSRRFFHWSCGSVYAHIWSLTLKNICIFFFSSNVFGKSFQILSYSQGKPKTFHGNRAFNKLLLLNLHLLAACSLHPGFSLAPQKEPKL